VTERADISAYQGGAVDFDQIKASGAVQQIISRAGGGDSPILGQPIYSDAQFARNWSETKRVGLTRGAYWFYNPAVDPAAQAQKFLSLVPDRTAADILAGDFEMGGVETAGAKVFTSIITANHAGPQEVYGNAYQLRDELQGDPYFAKFALWLAGYPSYPFIPPPWTAVAAHQYTSSGSVPGIVGNVDLSHVYAGDLPHAAAIYDEEVPMRIEAGGEASLPGGLNDATHKTILYATSDSSDGPNASAGIDCFFNGPGGPISADHFDISVNTEHIIDLSQVGGSPQGDFYVRVKNPSARPIDVLLRVVPV
jgi:GH25 family lysozyme M1 (1,4-beta-N-acetylmuramidase)